MKALIRIAGAGFVLVLTGCATVQIPPPKAAWAECVHAQIAAATRTHHVYVPVADEEEFKLVEYLAAQQGKWTQRTRREGHLTACVFVFGR